MKYLIMGASGMAGHVIAHYLIEQGERVDAAARRDVKFCETYILDVRNTELLKKIVINGQYDYIINCVGILNTVCDKNISDAIFVNSYMPHFLADIIKKTKTRLIHMSTDCVFSGKRGGYTEMDVPDGETIYDKTKALGEIIDNRNLTFRNSIVGPDINENGIGLFNWFMKQTGETNGFTKSIWTGVTTITLARAIYEASKKQLVGLYNLVNNYTISKYELLNLFNKYMNKGLKINKIDGVIHNKSLICTRNDFDFIVPTYEEQICEMTKWISEHKDLYPQYFNRSLAL